MVQGIEVSQTPEIKETPIEIEREVEFTD